MTWTAILHTGTEVYSGNITGEVVRWAESAQQVFSLGSPIVGLLAAEGEIWAVSQTQMKSATQTIQLPHKAELVAQRRDSAVLVGPKGAQMVRRKADGFELGMWHAFSSKKVHDLDVSVDGTHFVTIEENIVTTRSTADGKVVGKFSRKADQLWARFGPKNDVLFFCGHSSYRVSRGKIGSGRGRGELNTTSRWNGPLASSADGRYLLALSNGDVAQLYDVVEGRALFATDPIEDFSLERAWASLGGAPKFKQFAPGLVQLSRIQKTDHPPVVYPTFGVSPDGKQLALGGPDDDIILIDVDSCQMTRGTGEVIQPALSRLAHAGDVRALGRDEEHLYVMDPKGRVVSITARGEVSRLLSIGGKRYQPEYFHQHGHLRVAKEGVLLLEQGAWRSFDWQGKELENQEAESGEGDDKEWVKLERGLAVLSNKPVPVGNAKVATIHRPELSGTYYECRLEDGTEVPLGPALQCVSNHDGTHFWLERDVNVFELWNVDELERGPVLIFSINEFSSRMGTPHAHLAEDTVVFSADGREDRILVFSADGRLRRALAGSSERLDGFLIDQAHLLSWDQVGVVRSWDLSGLNPQGEPCAIGRGDFTYQPFAYEQPKSLEPTFSVRDRIEELSGDLWALQRMAWALPAEVEPEVDERLTELLGYWRPRAIVQGRHINENLAEDSTSTQAFAIHLSGWEGAAGLDRLNSFLRNEDTWMQQRALWIAEKFHFCPEVRAEIPRLVELMMDRDEDLALMAENALRKLSELPVEALAPALSHRRYWVRRTAISLLAKEEIPNSKAIPLLLAATKDKKNGWLAVLHLGERGAAAAEFPGVVETLEGLLDSQFGYAAAALCQMGVRTHIAEFRRRINEGYASTAVALHNLAGESAATTGFICGVLVEKHSLSWSKLEKLQDLPQKVEQRILQLLEDPSVDWHSRCYLMSVAAATGMRSALPILLKCTDSDEECESADAVKALGALGQDTSSWMKAKSDRVAMAAIRAAFDQGKRTAPMVNELVRLLKQDSDAIDLLRKMGPVAAPAVPRLKKMLDETDMPHLLWPLTEAIRSLEGLPPILAR